MIIRSDIAANVWKVEVETGQTVGAEQVLAILESMKMEIPVEAPVAAKVVEVFIHEGQTISEDQPMFRLEAV